MKLDVNVLRYLSKDDFRVLTAVEMGQKNHEIVPLELVDSISGLKHGGAFKSIKTLLRHKLLHHEGRYYDGYRLTYMGYDFLAIRALVARGHISGVGRQIGVGKESDIFEVTNDDGEVFALKMHRLGRTSFRAVKSKRDYLGKRQNYSWLYLSRLAALKEYAFMKALYEHGFPVPQAIDNNRHAVLMTLVDARPMVQVRTMAHPARVYLSCMELLGRLAGKGLIHCDFNEFNLLINEDTEDITLIDFPQMVSVTHANAQELFERDVECIVRFFSKKVGYVPELDPELPYVRPVFSEVMVTGGSEEGGSTLDVELEASGFQRQHQKVLEQFMEAGGSGDEDEGEEDDEDEEGEGEEASGSGGEEGSQEGEEGELAAGVSGRTAAAAAPGGEAAEDGVGALDDGAEGSDVERRLRALAGASGAAGEGIPEEEGGSGSGEEDGSEEGEEGDEEGGRRRGPKPVRQRAPRAGKQPMRQEDVQHIVTAQQRKQKQKQALMRASRNSTKGSRGKKGKASVSDGW